MICLLARLARELLGHPDRLDDLLELALGGPVRVLDERRVEQPRADELLGDRRGAAAVAAERTRAPPTRSRPDRSPAFSQNVLSSTAVVASSSTFGISSKVDDLALGVAEAGQLDLAGPVVDDRLLGQDVVGQRRRVDRDPGRERDVDTDRGEGEDGADPGEEQEDDDRDVADGGRSGAARGSGRGRFERRTWTRKDSGSRSRRDPAVRSPKDAVRTRNATKRRRSERVGCVAARVETTGLTADVSRDQAIRPAPSVALTGRTIGVRPVLAG